VATTCGDGVREGTEACDDCNAVDGDGCTGCALDAFYECAPVANSCSMSGVCTPITRYVRILEFPAPMAQPQAVHYDPLTRSFIAYGFNASQGYQEVCLDGTFVPNGTRARPRALVGDSLDGSTYDPFNDRWLFIRQNGQLTEIERVVGGVNPDCVTQPPSGEFCLVEVQRVLPGVGVAGGIAVGDDGRLYVCNHHQKSIKVFERFGTTVVQTIAAPTDSAYLDNLYTLPGEGLIGYYNRPPGAPATVREFAFHRYDGTLVGRSGIPGVLFENGRPFPANSDGGEAAPDGGSFLVCSEYLDNDPDDDGICQLFSRACGSHGECASRVPGTACKLDAMVTEGVPPYCYAPATARDDAYSVAINSADHDLDVLRNDTRSASVCTGSLVAITAVTAPSLGGAVTIAGGGASVVYTPLAGACGQVESFEYTADLGGESHTAAVRVLVECVCGDGITQANEQCDNGTNLPGSGCVGCRREPACGNGALDDGEQCDDGGTQAGDGCSPTCTVEFG
jgi:cysteine-rich repeat protein